MCLTFTKGPWFSKNKEPEKNEDLVCVGVENLPFEWAYAILPLSKKRVNLKRFVKKAIKSEKIYPLEVQEKSYAKFRDVKSFIPKKIITYSDVLVPIILKRDREKVAMVSINNYSEYWAAFGNIVALSTAIHHKDRNKSMMPSIIFSKILDLPFDEAMARFKSMLKKFNVAGFTGIIGDSEKKAIVDHLFENTKITKISPEHILEKPVSFFTDIFTKLFRYRDVTLGYNNLIVRSNFSPFVGYWKKNWEPDDTPSRKLKIIRSINRYLRAKELLGEEKKLNLRKVLKAMSDHGVYTDVSKKYKKYYKKVMRGWNVKAKGSLDKEKGYTSICTHPEIRQSTKVSTIYNFTANAKRREVFVTLGNPCKKRVVLKYKMTS